MNYLGNAFSLQMLQDDFATVDVTTVEKHEIPSNCESVIGHQDLADYLGVPMNRVNLKLSRKDTLYVAQFTGGRLPEGTTMLDADQQGMLKFYCITVEYPAQEFYAEQIIQTI